MLSFASIVQHGLFLFLLVVAPAWDFYDTRRLKNNPTSVRRLAYYRALCAWLWIAAIVACVTVGWRAIFTISAAPAEASWLFGTAWVRYVVMAVLVLFAAAVAITYLQVAWMRLSQQPRRYASSELMHKKVSYAYLFPTTWTERRWWVAIGLTAGICEETLFRGFLLQYLHGSPWQFGLTTALVLSSVIFGLQHLYQDAQGTVASAVLGFLFALLFLLSGNLLLPIVLHAALDLRLLAILRPPAE